jgi:ATP-dependent exoDNAse (exonuclease V) beta subunit
VYPLFGSDRDQEADIGLRLIRNTLAANPDDDMAVLVRGRAHLHSLLSRLRDAEIAYRAVEIDRLTDLPEVIDVLALTRALAHRGDRLAWLAILRSPWVGLDWCDLHTLVHGRNDDTVWELLHADQQLAGLSTYGSKAVLRFREQLATAMLENRIKSLRDTVESTWLALGGPAILGEARAVENVYRFLDVIETLEEGGTLLDVAELEDALDLEYVSTDSNARLQVMTMHRAKGLQFDHVLLYGLGRAPGQQERTVLNWFDVPGEHGIDEKVISPVGPRAEIENDPLHRFIERIEATKSRHELGRLLYVACTRTRRSLHLLGHVEVSADGSEFKLPRAGSLLRLLWPMVANEFENAFDPDAVRSKDTSVDAWLTPELRRFETKWELPEYQGLNRTDEQSVSGDTDTQVEFYWVGSGARVAGTIVHRWLQMIVDQRIQLDAGQLADVQSITARWLRGMGIPNESMPAIVARIEEALNGMLGDPQGRWLLAGDGHTELPLTGIYEGHVTSVVLDRVRIDDDGTHWVVDYKTSSHEGGNLQSFLRAEVDRYTPQLHKYFDLYRNYSGADVRCALYFPLLQEFVEVSL